MKRVYTIGSDGFVQWKLFREEAEDYICSENETDVPIPSEQTFYKHEWDDKKWVEGEEPEPTEPIIEKDEVAESDIMLAELIIETELRLSELEGRINA